jgi:hypothetical protein
MIISTKEAASEISRLLVGSDLDEIKVAGRSISLRFISDKLVEGRLKFVYVDFCCRSKISKAEDKWLDNDFVEERSIFLSKIFPLYATKIISVSLKEDGSLILNFDKNDMVIFLTEEDLDADDSVWDVSSEALGDYSRERCFVSCAPVEGRINFYNEKE